MYIYLLENNKLAIGTKSYIYEAMDFFDKDVSTKEPSAANKNLHEVNPVPPIIPKNQLKYVHSIVATFVWTTKLSWPYIETTVSFPSNKVKSPM